MRQVRDRIVAIGVQYRVEDVVAEMFFIPQRKRAGGAVGTLWLHGIVVIALLDAGLAPPLYVPGPTLRKWTSGSGKAEKEDMRAAILAKHKIDIDDDNVADAYALTHLAIAWSRWKMADVEGMTKYEREAVLSWERALS